MRTIKFTVPGTIAGKGRARTFFDQKAGRIVSKTPAKTTSHEAMVRHFANEAMRAAHVHQLIGPLRLTVRMYRLHPKSWTARRCASVAWVEGRPDLDNVAKLISDAMNNIVYRDDAQITALHITREFNFDNERVEIEITELEAA